MEEASLIPLLEIAYDTKKAFLIYAIVASVVTGVLVIVFIVLRKSIALCVELFQQVLFAIYGFSVRSPEPPWPTTQPTLIY